MERPKQSVFFKSIRCLSADVDFDYRSEFTLEEVISMLRKEYEEALAAAQASAKAKGFSITKAFFTFEAESYGDEGGPILKIHRSETDQEHKFRLKCEDHMEEFRQEQEKEQQAKEAVKQKKLEEEERETYLRLKAKYESE